MTLRLFAILAGLLALGGAAQAADAAKPAAGDRTLIVDCVRKAAREGTSADDCMYLVAAPCQGKPGGDSTVGMRSCMQRETVIWDEMLNRAYGELRESLSKQGAGKLKSMQLLWIKWRDAKCEMPYLIYEGGTIAGPVAAQCLLRATAIRAIELRQAVGASDR